MALIWREMRIEVEANIRQQCHVGSSTGKIHQANPSVAAAACSVLSERVAVLGS